MPSPSLVRRTGFPAALRVLGLALAFASTRMCAAEVANELPVAPSLADAGLNAALDRIAPEVQKWATVCVVRPRSNGSLQFDFVDYRDTGSRTDFWPASTIKIYAVVAALELLHDRGFSLDTTVQFEHRDESGQWILDCARSMREMLSEVFRRSSNEDYTLLLRLVGIDRINTEFLIPARGFPHSALMRGYVTQRPHRYVATEPQRLTLRSADGAKSEVIEQTWSGRFYAEERGCTVIDNKTGNMTSPRELAECLRRILFHEEIPEAERYHLDAEQLRFLRLGGGGLVGLETRNPDSGPTAWTGGADTIFPNARFFHKCGVISNYALELAAIDDSPNSAARFIFVPVVAAGEASKPERGEKLISQMSRAIAEWVRASGSPIKDPQP